LTAGADPTPQKFFLLPAQALPILILDTSPDTCPKGKRPKGGLPLADTVPLPPPTDWPLYWFAALEKAVEEGDHQTAAEAQLELARLGVRVAYGRPGAGKERAKRVEVPHA
jgi:hypothetical protein